MKIAICGTGPTLDQAPWDDESYEIWGLAHRYHHYKRSDVLFEVHKRDNWKDPEWKEYLEWLDNPDRGVDVFSIWNKDYPECSYLDVDYLSSCIMGRNYFASTFSYILCHAILEGATEIGLYGIDMTLDSEYAYQRPNAEYLIGIAQGKGIKITIAKGSALLNAPYTYGDGKPMNNPLIAKYEERLVSCKDEIKRVSCELDQLTGAEHEIEEMIKSLRAVERGALQE